MFDIVCRYHVPLHSTWLQVDAALEVLRPYTLWLGKHDPTMGRWLLGGNTLEEARQHEVFGPADRHAAALARLQRKTKLNDVVIYLWNGDESDRAGASLVLSADLLRYPSSIELSLDGRPSMPRLGDYRQTAEFVAMLARDTSALLCFVYNETAYFTKKIFPDRDGVGWMLYLPHVLTEQDVPEAGALIPVDKNGQRIGTIVVSVTDAVFDDRNPDHLRRAQAIEVRLVSLDLLPTYDQQIHTSV
jgi:hypothetical protein